MAKEQFFYSQTRQLFTTLENISQRSGVSRGKAFEDLLQACVAALAAETMEPAYFEAIQAHTEGSPGKRGVDLFPKFLAQLIESMSEQDQDLLGDLFEGSISYGEKGQFLTPESVSELMANLTIDAAEKTAEKKTQVINDPCCGTGRMLLKAGEINPQAELCGQDIDARCVRMTALNLSLRGKYGYVVCGNSLTLESKFAYRVGSFYHELPNGRRRGVIREIPLEQTPVPFVTDTTRTATQGLFAQQEADSHEPDQAQKISQTIMEVPQWLFRLEQRMDNVESGNDSDQSIQVEKEESTNTKSVPDNDRVKTQKKLF
ncbi:N-6 DNA methylase [Gimesia aquarii]|uniref:site-specific DNA-methyltransferase (adenine-specific) n=1 Tax=Gimesia aquarii TaxID=2527964 RepID=A0A517X066_9PLAN|nr:N-6 DNA methylase [Gimesia aquarii]QDU10888.1 N-6 DNA Methylase [Gimesia aquarii]